MLGVPVKSSGKCERAQKLGMDWHTSSVRPVSMDKDTVLLIRQLTTRAGLIMEDASADAVLLKCEDRAELSGTLARLEAAAHGASLLIKAAQALVPMAENKSSIS
jgi:hypothetical protein